MSRLRRVLSARTTLDIRTLVLAGILCAIIGTAVLYAGVKLGRRARFEYVMWSGLRLNRSAWEAGFLERNLPVPPEGPRDGYWGRRIGVHVVDPQLGWVLPEMHFPGLLETDKLGMQHVTTSVPPVAHVLIMGASTAFGGYASSIERTYFHQVAKQLEAAGVPVRITVYATGAWKSTQELKALRLHGRDVKPDLVLFLDGLNDITNGSNAHSLYNEPTTTLDGSRWHPLYNEHDYQQRAALFVSNMNEAYEDLHRDDVPLVVALQPALFEKPMLSPIETVVERESLRYYGDKAGLHAVYEQVRQGLRELASKPGAYFIDASRVFNHESKTIFTDVWHFSDPGHTILATAIAPPLVKIIRTRGGQAKTSPPNGEARVQ